MRDVTRRHSLVEIARQLVKELRNLVPFELPEPLILRNDHWGTPVKKKKKKRRPA
jgi:hypothetical protein